MPDPAEVKVEQLPTITQSTPAPQSTPKAAEEMTFNSLEDIDVEQLPEQSKEGSTKVEAPVKVEPPEKKIEEVKLKSESKSEGEKKGEGNTEESKLPSYLKAPKTEGKVEESGEGKGVIKPILPKPDTRDFTGFSKEEADAGRKMANDAFAIYKKAISDRNELSKLKDTSYLQHPNAYTLDPEFRKTQVQLSFAQKEANYWENQLSEMDSGKPLVPITGFDSKTGHPILGQPIPATKALEEKVRMMIHNCYQAGQDFQTKLAEYPARYASQIKNSVAGIEDFRKQQFGWVNDSKMLDYSINIEGLGERTLKQIGEDVNKMIPPWMHSSPAVPLIQDLVISVRLLQAELAEAKITKAVETYKENEQELVEPSSREKSSSRGKGQKVHGVDEFVTDPSLGI